MRLACELCINYPTSILANSEMSALDLLGEYLQKI